MPAMSWLKFDCNVHANPKVATLSDEAFRVWTRILCLARISSVPGRVGLTADKGLDPNWIKASSGTKSRKTGARLLQEIAAAGLIVLHENGVIEVHDFEEHNRVPPSKTPEARRIQKAKERAGDRDVASVATMSPGDTPVPSLKSRHREEDKEEEEEKELLDPRSAADRFRFLKAKWLETYRREKQSDYPWDLEDTRKLNDILESALSLEELSRRVDRFFVDEWCRTRADVSLFKTKFKSLAADATPPRGAASQARAQERENTLDDAVARARTSCPEWAGALERVRRMDRPGPDWCARWLAPLRAQVEGGELVLHAPDAHHAAFLKDNVPTASWAAVLGSEETLSVRIATPGGLT